MITERINKISVSQHAQELQNTLIGKLDEFCPLESFKVSNQDKPWINKELKILKRRKMREYQKRGKSEKYQKLDQEFHLKYKAAAKKFMDHKIKALKETKPGQAFKILKSMGAQAGECSDDTFTFTLPSHQANRLTSKQSAERIAEYFATISAEYQPLSIDKLPQRVQLRLSSKSSPPEISELVCYEKITAAKKPQSGVPGD